MASFFGFLIAVFTNKTVGNLYGRLITNVKLWKIFVGVGCVAMILVNAFLCTDALLGVLGIAFSSTANQFAQGFFTGPIGMFLAPLIWIVFFSLVLVLVFSLEN